jgi:hypothetical protein
MLHAIRLRRLSPIVPTKCPKDPPAEGDSPPRVWRVIRPTAVAEDGQKRDCRFRRALASNGIINSFFVFLPRMVSSTRPSSERRIHGAFIVSMAKKLPQNAPDASLIRHFCGKIRLKLSRSRAHNRSDRALPRERGCGEMTPRLRRCGIPRLGEVIQLPALSIYFESGKHIVANPACRLAGGIVIARPIAGRTE